MRSNRFLRSDLAKFVKDPRTIKSLEELFAGLEGVTPSGLVLNLDNSITLTLSDGSQYTTDPIPTGGSGSEMPIVIPDGGVFTVPDNVQALYNIPITLIGSAMIVTVGTGVLTYAD